MAKKDKDLRKRLRAGGVRKKVARVLAAATGSPRQGKKAKRAASTIENFQSAAAELDKRVRRSRRSEAGKKAARTRKRQAAKRSASARKGARKRARSRS